MSNIYFRSIILVIGLTFSPFFSHGAVNCAPEGKGVQDLNPIALNAATTALFHRVFNLTTDEGDWKTCTRDLSAQVRKLARETETNAATLQGGLGNSYLTLILIAESQLVALRVRAGQPKLPDLVMQFNTQDYLRFFPLTLTNIDGITGEIRGDRTRIWLNGETQVMAHLRAIAKTRKNDEAKQYFDTSRCLLARVFIAKAQGHAILGGRTTDINLAGQTACEGFELSKLVDRQTIIENDKRLSQLVKNLKKTESFLNEADIARIQKIATDAKAEVPTLVIRSALKKETDPSLVLIDQLLGQAEEKLVQSDDIARDLVGIGSQLQGLIMQALASNNIQAKLNHFEALYTRLVLADIIGEIAFSNSLALTRADRDLVQNLNESIIFMIAIAVDSAAKSELVQAGHIQLEKAQEFSLLQNSDLIKGIRQLVVNNKTAEKVLARIKLQPKIPLLEGFAGLIPVSIELQKITDPEIDFKNLDFNPFSLTRVFDGNIESLPPEFKFYVDQILSRKTHEDKLAIWARFQQRLEADAEEKGYRCEKRTFLERTGIGLKAFVRLAGDPLLARSQSCVFIKQYAEYMGLNKTNPPLKIADIYRALEKHNSEDDIKKFDKLYRDNLKDFFADKNRILDMPVRKLGVRSDLRLYDVIAENADLSTIPTPTPTPDPKALAEALTKPQPVKVEEEEKIPAIRSDKADYVNGLVDAAVRLAQTENETSALKVLHSKNIEDLEHFILESNLLDELLGSARIGQFLPGDPNAAQMMARAYPSVYQYHVAYKDTLFRRKGLSRALNDKFVSAASLPYMIFGATWAVREIAVRLGAATGLKLISGIGSGLKSIAESTKVVTLGYSHMLNLVFATGVFNNYFWHKDVKESLETIESLKIGDVLIGEGDIASVNYSHYLFKKTMLDLDRKKSRNGMIRDGFFALLSPFINVIEPAARAGAIDIKGLNRFASWVSSLRNISRGARLDKIRLQSSYRKLGLDGRSTDVVTLQTARSRMLSVNGTQERVIEEAYKRIVFTLGQRAQQALGNKEKAKAVAKELFGFETRVDELHRLASEYNRLFPDLVKGGL